MDGGIKRHFRLEPCRRFSAALDAVKAFFLEGLPEKVVDSCTRRLSELLKQLFEKDTAYLVKLYASAPDNGDSTVGTKCGSCFAYALRAHCVVRYNIFRVIRHRTKEDATAKVGVRNLLHSVPHCVLLQKFIDKFKADIELRNFIKHLKPH